MTVRELKDFIENCNDDAVVTMCGLNDENPIRDSYAIGIAYIIHDSSGLEQICLMPD